MNGLNIRQMHGASSSEHVNARHTHAAPVQKSVWTRTPTCEQLVVIVAFSSMFLANMPMIISCLTVIINGANSYLNQQQMQTQHEPFYIEQAIACLNKPFVNPTDDFMQKIAGLSFVPRDPERTMALNSILNQTGHLALLEGPSGSGKTSFIQYALQQRHAPAIYWSVRDEKPSLEGFARAFGIRDLPSNLHKNVLSIVSQALASHKEANPHPAPVPVLVIDDVHRLLPLENDLNILSWCLEAAEKLHLTVVFVSSEPVRTDLKALSGFGARLRVRDDSFDYIPSKIFMSELMKIPGPWPAFTSEEAKLFVDCCGTHMTDLHQVQSSRSPDLSVKLIIDDIVIAESNWMFEQLTKNFYAQMSSPSIHEKMKPLLAFRICEILAAREAPMYADQLVKEVKSGEWSPDCAVDLKLNAVREMINDLHVQKILRRFYDPKESVSFHRPVKRVAFLKLRAREGFQEIYRTATNVCAKKSF